MLLGKKFTVVSFDVEPTPDNADHHRVQVDITDTAQVVNDVAKRYGRLDVLINNAGALARHAVDDTPEAVWDHVINVNLKGAFLMSRAAIPHLRRVQRGIIVNVSLVHASASVPRTAAYAWTQP